MERRSAQRIAFVDARASGNERFDTVYLAGADGDVKVGKGEERE